MGRSLSISSFLLLSFLLFAPECIFSQSNQAPIKVELVNNGGKWTLLRGGEPYYINGVGGQSYMDRAVKYGANSVRTWGAGEAIAILDDAHADIKRLLVLPASCQSSVLLGAYELFSENPLHGCVLAKVDEAYSLGEVFSLIVEKELPVAYITNGQKIPDDIEVGCPSSLIYRMYEAGVAINSTAHFDCAMPGITELKGKTLNSVHAKHHPTSHV